jgi:phosphoglucomutase
MDVRILDKAKSWLSSEYDESTRAEVQHLIDNDPKGLDDAFYQDLEFGTGGLRGVMGVGTNRMNNYVVGMATQGLANYINKAGATAKKSVAIAHDCRRNSDVFARRAAEVLAANGITVYLFPELRPTPVLSFAVRYFNCTAGIVVTASHNPPEYNGYKVYWSDGAQIVSPQDKGIIDEVRKVQTPAQVASTFDESKIILIGPELDEAYQVRMLQEIVHPIAVRAQRNMPIGFTNLHGTAVTHIPSFLKRMGFENVHSVKSQEKPDGNFPTVESPNPEERAALDEVLKLGESVGAEIVLGADPDCDRIGIAVRNLSGKLELLNGNETASMLTYYLLEGLSSSGRLPVNGFVCNTIVTTELIDRIAEHYGVKVYSTLTGFKWIADKIRELEGKEKFIGGGEESYGYMIGDAVRDKDAVVTAGMLCEIAAWAKNNGSSFYKELIGMYAKFGFYREALVSLVKKGKDGAAEINAIMQGYRDNTPATLAGSDVLEMRDHKTGIIRNMKTGETRPTGLPGSNVIQFYLADGSKVTARPSGTEPKIKFYFSLNTAISGIADYEDKKAQLEKRIAELKQAFVNS